MHAILWKGSLGNFSAEGGSGAGLVVLFKPVDTGNTREVWDRLQVPN